MVLYLEFAFWKTWQIREQTWHICQAEHGLAKGRSRASPGLPRDPNFLRAISGPSIAIETLRPSTRRRLQPIVVARDSIASTGPPHATVPIATNSISRNPLPSCLMESSRRRWTGTRIQVLDGDLLGKHENRRWLYAREGKSRGKTIASVRDGK